ncbi:MAG: DUF87 domain-containing protein [Nanoarchaeota archaeon]|nr:DUF87 domain-containing protein [Nanoarchaeota archaeon]
MNRGNYTLAGGKGNCSIVVWNFLPSDVNENVTYLFQIEDAETTNARNTTLFGGLNITKPAIELNYSFGNNSNVNRSAGFASLGVRAYDRDNKSFVNGINVSFWITTDGATYDAGNITQTNASGYANTTFNPVCAYSAGIQIWMAGIVDSRYANSNTTENYTTKIWGDLNANLMQPLNGQIFLRGSNITIRANITDDCGTLWNMDNTTMATKSTNAGTLYACSPIANESTGIYNCTFNTSSPTVMPARYYNATVFANKTYYNFANTTYANSFFIETSPVITASNVNPDGGGWGKTYTFFVNVTDEDYDGVEVTFYERALGGSWVSSGIKTCASPCINQTLNFTKSYLCSNYQSQPVREYTFNATDTKYISEIAKKNMTLTKDTILVEAIDNITTDGNISIYRPVGDYNLALRLFDNDKSAYVDIPYTLTKIWVTQSGPGTNYIDLEGAYLYTNETGHFNKTFNPGCTPKYSIGIHGWKGGVTDDSCYVNTNSSIYSLNITTAPLIAAIEQPNDAMFRRDIDNITLRGNVTDDCGLVNGSTTSLSAYNGQSYQNCTAGMINDEGAGWYNCTLTPVSPEWSVGQYGKYNTSMYASKQYYNISNITTMSPSFNLTDPPEIKDMTWTSSNPVTSGWGTRHTFTVKVKDDEAGYDTDTVYLWKWHTSTGWALINSTTVINNPLFTTVSFEQRFTCADIGTNYYKFNVSDRWGNTNETQNASFTIGKDAVFVQLIPASNVDREGPATTNLKVRVRDTDNDSVAFNWIPEGYSGKMFVTTNGSGSNVWTVANGSMYTDSGSYLSFDFNPECAPLYKVGAQDWRGGMDNDTCFVDTNSSSGTFTITGQLKEGIDLPPYGSVYAVGTNVTIRTNSTTDCSELVNDSAISIQLSSPLSVWENCSATINNEGNGYYNCSWNTEFHYGGYYNVQMNSSRTNYYFNTTTWNSQFYMNNTPPNVENFSVSPESEGWGSVYTYRAEIYDAQKDNITCALYVNTSESTGWVLKNSTTIETQPAQGRANCTLSVSNFACGEMGTDNSYKFQIYDGTNLLNTSVISGPNLTEDSVSISYFYGNNSVVNRSGTETTRFIVSALDTDRGSIPVLTGSNIKFWVTKNGAVYDAGTDIATNSSGYANYDFDPTCSPTKYDVGPEYWAAGIIDGCYVATNLSQNLTTTVIGSLINTIQIPDIGTEFLRGENITIKSNSVATIQSDCVPEGLDGVNNEIIFHNENGINNYSCVTGPGTEGYYECTRNTTDMKARWYNTTMRSWMQYYHNGTSLNASHFFVKTLPVLTNETAITNPGGWGETFYFKVNLTDEDLDNVTVNLYARDTAGGSWGGAKNSTIISAPINQTVVIYWNTVPYCAIGTWEYYFDATDTHNPLDIVSTTPKNFTIEQDDVQIALVSGDNSFAWRNGTYNTTFTLNITDTDRKNITIGDSSSRFWVTVNASNPGSFDAGKDTMSSGGLITYYFMQQLPDGGQKCDYSVGIQKWKGGTFNDVCYKDANSTAYSVIINSSLMPNITNLHDQGYLRGDKIPINVSVIDDCQTVENATVINSLVNPPNTYYCSKQDNWAWNESNGTYICIWDSTNKPYKWYNVTATVSKNYYVQSSTPGTDRFFLGTTPKLDFPSVNPTFGGWGENHQFSVRLTSLDLATNNVSLWKSLDNISWNVVNWQLVNTPVNQWVYFNERFTCNDYLTPPSGRNYYQIKSASVFGFSNETPILNFTLDYDNITIPTLGGNDSVRRLGTTTAFLQARIYDSDYGVYQNNTAGNIWITSDGNNFSSNQTCTTSNGYCNINYDPQCDISTGVQKWKLAVEDACYQKVNSTNATLTVMGQLYSNHVNPTTNAIINRNTTTPLNTTVINDCNGAITGATIYWYNSTPKQIAIGYNTTWKVPVTYAKGPETITTNATQQYYDNGTNSTQVYIYGWSKINYTSLSNSSSYLAGEYVESYCMVIDANTTAYLQNYNVSYYKNGSLQTSAMTNENGTALWNWSTASENFGWYNITCIISNDNAQYYTPSIPQIESNVRINRSTVLKSLSLSNSSIFRNDSYNPYKTNISVTIYDAVIGPADGANVTFYNSTELIGNCTTNPSGNCFITYNAPDNSTPGIYIIYINSTKTGLEPSITNQTNITVTGVLFINITQPANDSSWGKSTTLNVTSDIWNENGYIDNATVNWYIDTNYVASGQNASFSLSSQTPGSRKLTANATKSYYQQAASNISLRINGLADVNWWYPPDSSLQPYPVPFEIQCRVTDNTSASVIQGYDVNFWYWNGSSYIFNGTYATDNFGIAGTTWYPDSKGSITFMCNITENTTMYYSPNIKSATATIMVQDTNPPSITNTSILPNQSIEANLNSTAITANVTDDLNVSSVIARIVLPNSSVINRTMANISQNIYTVQYLPPIGGNYSVTIMAWDSPPESNLNATYAGNFTVWGKINMTSVQTDEAVINGITQSNGAQFVIEANATNLGPANAYNVTLTMSDSPPGVLSYNTTQYSCGNLSTGQNCSRAFLVTVPPATPPQIIYSKVTTSWRNPDLTLENVENITDVIISANPIIDIYEPSLINNTPHGMTTKAGTLTIISAGNWPVDNIAINTVGGNLATSCPGCNITISQPLWGTLPAGSNFTTDITVVVPFGQPPGNYWTSVLASSDAGVDWIIMNLTVPLNTSWTRNPATFGTILALVNSSDSVGNIVATHIGNQKIDFKLYESQNGSALVSFAPLAFTLNVLSSVNISLNYTIPISQTPGMYYYQLLIRNTSANPPEYITDMWLNVTDTPPTISNVIINPMGYEAGTEYTNITARITDNVAVASAWINATKPNGTEFIKYFDTNGPEVFTNYSENETGIHRIRICASDVMGLEGCTQEYNVSVMMNTTLLAETNITNSSIGGVLLASGVNVSFNFSIRNIGYSRALNANTTISVPENWSVTDSFFTAGNIIKDNAYSNTTMLQIAPDSMGTYYINFTSNWTNFDNTTDWSLTQIKIIVTSNPALDVIDDPLTMYVESGSSGNYTFVLNSTGNDIAQNIQINCTGGIACTAFNMSLNPQYIASLVKGNASNITINASIPVGYIPGVYNGVLNVSSDTSSIKANISVIVPANLTWRHSPTSIKMEVAAGTNGTFGIVTVSNIGNLPVVLQSLSTNTTLFTVNASTINLPVGTYSTVAVNYTAPLVSAIENYIAYFRTVNSTAVPQNQSTLLNITVQPIYLYIVSPTTASPKINVSSGNTVETTINLTYSLQPLYENVTWEINLTNEGSLVTVNTTYANYSNTTKLWTINFTAPAIMEGAAHTLIAKAFYSTKNISVEGIQKDAIVYVDSAAPLISLSAPTAANRNSIVPIYVNITDSGGVRNALLEITDPSSLLQSVNATLMGSSGNLYRFNYNYSNTSLLGTYRIVAKGYDLSGNMNTTNTTFDIYNPAYISGYLLDIESPNSTAPIPGNFRMYKNDTGTLLHSFATNNITGYYYQSAFVRMYDVLLDALNVSMKFKNFNMPSEGITDPVSLGNIPLSLIGSGPLKAVYVTSKMNAQYMNITFDYSPYIGVSANDVQVYYCGNWTNQIGCTGTWFRQNSSVDTLTRTVMLNTQASAGAYALSQFICGNKMCESIYGESNANCPKDCPIPEGQEIPPIIGGGSTSGGGGGGGGGGGTSGGGGSSGGGSAGVPVATIKPDNRTTTDNVPIEIKSTLLYITLAPGEREIHSIEIKNNLNEIINSKLTVEGLVWELIKIEKTDFDLGPKSTENVKIEAYALPSTRPGIYTGDIVAVTGNMTYRTPITIKIELKEEPLLDVILKMLSDIVRPGDDAQFLVTIKNMGETASVEDIIMNYVVKNLQDGTVLTTDKETLAVNQTLTYTKTIRIPNGTAEARYVIDANATYANGVKYAGSAATFDVSMQPWPVIILRRLFTSWLTYIILLIVIPGIYFGRRAYNAYKDKKARDARYIFPMDYAKLPQKGDKSLQVGKIAETDINSYLDIKNLTMHSIAAGGTGSGKSVTAMVTAEELLKRGIPVVVFDPTAQWSGFIRPCKDPHMIELYAKYGLKPEDAKAFKTNIIVVNSANSLTDDEIDLRKYMKPGEITVFIMSKLRSSELDAFVRRTIQKIFSIQWPEANTLKVLVVYDEMHRLLPKYGGKGGYVELERGCREFRKWGIGLFLISQVLSDFKGSIRANIANEIQLRTKYNGDINRVKQRYGTDYALRVVKLTVGAGLLQNPEFNEGKPWFIQFRPLLHDTGRLSEEELTTYTNIKQNILNMETKIAALKSRGIDTYDIELELNMARDKTKQGMFKMAETYMESVKARLSSMGGGA